ncbi:MAG: small multi-drug export protein [Oscillospiraceae bacterium]|nr:small multi-drug export protein [Oscillospiraceae bacterium]
MVPVVELRGGVPAGVAMGLPIPAALLASLLGNNIPVPFVILFSRRLFRWIRVHIPRLGGLVDRLEGRAYAKMSNKNLLRWKAWGLLMFVAIPLPGTGAWTGSLIAALMELRLKNSVPIIFLGTLIAGLIMTALTYGVTVVL